jgi:hypothetical protein
VGYYPDGQTWAVLDGVPYQVGFDNAYKPGPWDLLRAGGWALAQYVITIEGLGEWGIPVARFAAGGTTLPQSFGLSNGKIAKTILPEYAGLADVAERLHAQIVETGEIVLTEAEKLDVAVRAFGAIYRVGLIECLALGLLRTDQLDHIVDLVADLPALRREQELAAAQKKSNSLDETVPDS